MTEFVPTAGNHPAALLDDLTALRRAVATDGATAFAALRPLIGSPAAAASVLNLCHYLALRHHDIRDLQRRLMLVGLSSLGRLEGRVLATIDAVIHALAAMAGRAAPAIAARPSSRRFFRGETALADRAGSLFGAGDAVTRRGRIMVTLPGTAADDAAFVADLVARGMDVARINCAHDTPDAWRAMAAHVRAAGTAQGREVRVLMDIAGPKIRTAAVDQLERKAKIEPGMAFRLIAEGTPHADAEAPFAALASLPQLVTRLRLGDRVLYDDGKVSGRVEARGANDALIRVDHAKTGGAKWKPEKGLNVPDTALGLAPLTAKDEADLAVVVEVADMLGYSFISEVGDLDLLDRDLARFGARGARLGVIAKIERPEAVRNLPALIARASGSRPFGIMIARGDLAAEIGFERLAEMQEEILWLGEAASVPVIWATQVLEDLVKDGVPSRGEMTDAAMAARAECVMLNKGPEVGAAVELLDRLMRRMNDHVHKKTPTLRALATW
ncbi:MAG: pyruvate kinase [Hyphomicrobiaceae bacterium]|nr:pyruvate kinase [Hyphomicrobiaceae bacterium]